MGSHGAGHQFKIGKPMTLRFIIDRPVSLVDGGLVHDLVPLYYKPCSDSDIPISFENPKGELRPLEIGDLKSGCRYTMFVSGKRQNAEAFVAGAMNTADSNAVIRLRHAINEDGSMIILQIPDDDAENEGSLESSIDLIDPFEYTEEMRRKLDIHNEERAQFNSRRSRSANLFGCLRSFLNTAVRNIGGDIEARWTGRYGPEKHSRASFKRGDIVTFYRKGEDRPLFWGNLYEEVLTLPLAVFDSENTDPFCKNDGLRERLISISRDHKGTMSLMPHRSAEGAENWCDDVDQLLLRTGRKRARERLSVTPFTFFPEQLLDGHLSAHSEGFTVDQAIELLTTPEGRSHLHKVYEELGVMGQEASRVA